MEKLNPTYEYRAATIDDLNSIWDKNITDNMGDNRWVNWKSEAIKNNCEGKSKTFVIIHDNKPIGEGTLLFSPECGAINSRTELADGQKIVNINALRMIKPMKGEGAYQNLLG